MVSSWFARIRAERKARLWDVHAMARKLREAAGGDASSLPDHEALVRSIRRWESGKISTPSERYRLLFSRALQIEEKALFGEASEDEEIVSLLVLPPAGAGVLPPGFTVESVEALLSRLYRLDAEFGGNELCQVVAGQAQAAAGLFGSPGLRADDTRRLYLAMAGLTQIAGWLSIDASRHAEASRYLTATIYAAHEADDPSLAGHALGYMSLHALYRDQPDKALALARTAIGLTSAGISPRARATAHNRAARAHARLGEADACKRSLDLAQAVYAETADEEEPRWVGYVGEIELSAQRGACFLDLGQADDAISEIEHTILLVRSRTPEHARDLAHYTIRLAAAYLGKGEVAHAAAIGERAHRMSSAIGSARVRERFTEFMDDLSAYKKVQQVRDLAEEVRASSY